MNDYLDEEPGQDDPFDRWRRRAGLGLAPVVFFVLWWVPLAGLAENAHRLLAVFGLVITLWLTEAIPLAVTALLGPTLCVVCGISTDKEMFKNFGHPMLRAAAEDGQAQHRAGPDRHWGDHSGRPLVGATAPRVTP